VAKDRLPELIVAEVVRLLREERIRQGISMNALAQQTGLSQSTISLLERDLRSPTLESLLKISAILKVNVGAIISRVTREVTLPRR
jgi:transcriptional regulator with XRE-family HTH domain